MSKDRVLAEILAFNAIISEASGYNLEEIYYLSNPKIMDYSVSIILEIHELLDKGYSYDEILEMIEDINLKKELEEDEVFFLKKDARKSLKLIYERKGENYDKN